MRTTSTRARVGSLQCGTALRRDRPAWYWLRLLLACCAVLSQPAAAASAVGRGPSIGNESLELVVDLHTGGVRHWRVLGMDGEPRDLAATDTFVLHGQLAGVSVEEWRSRAGGWRVQAHTPDQLELVLEHADLPWRVSTRWRLVEAQWRTQFSIEVTPLAAPGEDDALWLSVGPGIGERPVEGFGFAQSVYSYTDVTGRTASGVFSVRLDASSLGAAAGEGDYEWIGLNSRYFALVLQPGGNAQVPWRAELPSAEGPLQAFSTSLIFELPLADQPQKFGWSVFGGGKSADALGNAELDLQELLFSNLWSWMRWLTLGLMYVLSTLHWAIGNWGVAILLLAVLVRIVLYPLARNAMAAQRRFVAVQERIRPQLEQVRRDYKGEEQSERILRLYEDSGVSPLAGLKPLLIVLLQVPIFVALFHLLGQMFELRSESFLWMESLAEPDRLFRLGLDLPFFGAYFNLLPVLMALTTLASIKLAPAPAAASSDALRQNIMLALMAVGFFVLFYSFPSGMVLYWTMANALHIAQYWVGRPTARAAG